MLLKASKQAISQKELLFQYIKNIFCLLCHHPGILKKKKGAYNEIQILGLVIRKKPPILLA